MSSAVKLSELASLGAETAGAVHLEECRAAGISPMQLRWLVSSGRWQLVFPRVYVTFSGPIPLVTRQHAAVLYAGPGAALSHESAAALAQLHHVPRLITVTVPYPRQVASQPGLVIRRSRTFTEADVHPTLQPRRTRIERTVVDLLPDLGSCEAALALAAAAVSSRLTNAERLRAALQSAPSARWRCAVLEALPDVQGGAHSLLELKDVGLRRRHGLPEGIRQFRRATDGTEYLDVFIEEFRTTIELDGRLGHEGAREIWRDMKRDNRSEVLRLRSLRYGWADVIARPCEVAIQQAVILRQQGWRGRFKRCSRCPTDLDPHL